MTMRDPALKVEIVVVLHFLDVTLYVITYVYLHVYLRHTIYSAHIYAAELCPI